MLVRLLTPRGSGGVAVIELRGEGALAAVSQLAGITAPRAGELRLIHPRAQGEILDEALLVVRAPELVELHTHGGPALVEEVLALLRPEVGAGAPPASGPGLRAPREREQALPSPLELVPTAACAAGARLLLDQVDGAFADCLARIARAPHARATRMALALARRWRIAQRLLRPSRVLLAGPTNAGKSTLFNLLVGEGRAIVSELAGTTRDRLHGLGELDGWPIEWIDTAGEGRVEGRGGQARIERAGQARAREMARTADLVLRLLPLPAQGDPAVAPPRARAAADSAPTSWLYSRPDRLRGAPPEGPLLRSLEDPEGTLALVSQLVREALALPARAWRAGFAAPWCEAQAEALWRAARASDERAFARALEILIPRPSTLQPGRDSR